MKLAVTTLIAVLSASPALAQTPQFAGVGDVIYHADVKGPLPNPWGSPDIWGRKVIVGQIEVRYMGLTPAGAAEFQRSDVKIISNATTTTQDGLVTSEPLPPVITNVSVDLASDPTVLVNGETIRVMAATGSKVTYEVLPK